MINERTDVGWMDLGNANIKEKNGEGMNVVDNGLGGRWIG